MSTTVDDETILEILRSNDAPRMTTTEVAGQLPVTRGTTRTRLQRLVDDDLLERATEGNNVVWWLPEREDELAAWEPGTGADAPEPETDEDADEPVAEAADAAPDDSSVEVEATEQAKSETDDGDTAVEVEAVEEGTDEVEVTTPDEERETRTAADRSDEEAETRPSPADRQRAELSDDAEGLRALALLAATIAVLLLFRKLLASDGEGEETE